MPIGCRLDSEVARQAGGGEEVLRRDCGVYVAGDVDEFSRVQSDEGARVFRRGAGLLNAAAVVDDHVDDE